MCYSVITTSRSFFFYIPQIQMICHRGRRDFSSLMLNICTVLRWHKISSCVYLKHKTIYDLEIPLIGICPSEILGWLCKDTCKWKRCSGQNFCKEQRTGNKLNVTTVGAEGNTWTKAFLVAQAVKNPPAMQEIQVQSLGWEDSLEEAWQPSPVFLPGEFHGERKEPGRLQSKRSQRLGHDWSDWACT